MTEMQTTTRTYSNLHISTREELHRNFGGVICQSDFNTDHRGKNKKDGSEIAGRIIADYKHFAQLRKEGKYKYGW